MIYIESFIKISLGIKKMIGGNSQTHRLHSDLISLLLLSQNKESRLKKKQEPSEVTWPHKALRISSEPRARRSKGKSLLLDNMILVFIRRREMQTRRTVAYPRYDVP
jgi:hypothetical protein